MKIDIDSRLLDLWTFQPIEAINKAIEQVGHYVPDLKLLTYADDSGFMSAYHWMTNKMDDYGITRPSYSTKPIWAWYGWSDNKNGFRCGPSAKPDRRRTEFKSDGQRYDLIHLRIDKSRILLSDFDMWHTVLAWNLNRHMGTKDTGNPAPVILDGVDDPGIGNEASFVQATMWDIRNEDIVDVTRHRGL